VLTKAEDSTGGCPSTLSTYPPNGIEAQGFGIVPDAAGLSELSSAAAVRLAVPLITGI